MELTPFFILALLFLSVGLSILYLSPWPFWIAACVVIVYLIATTWRKYDR